MGDHAGKEKKIGFSVTIKNLEPMHSNFSESFARFPVRILLVAGGIFMFAHSLYRISRDGNPTAGDMFPLIIVPGICFYLGFLFVESDEKRLAKVVKVGRLFRWEYSVVQWDEVTDVEVYNTSRREFVNLKVKTVDGRTRSFSVPEDGNAAQKLKELARVRKANKGK